MPFLKIHSRLALRGPLAALLLVGGLALAGCTLAGEPVPAGPVERGSAEDIPPALTPAPTLELPPDVGYPVDMPDAAAGAALFSDRCAACHGADGSGTSGEMADVLAQQGAKPPDFTDADFVRQRSPQEFFRVITDGRLEALMPPWGQELTEAERWNLAFYLYTLSTSQDELAGGEAIYQERCAACHGQGGEGDGPEAAAPLPDLTDPVTAITRSPQALFETVTGGAGEGMPGFEETLSEIERWAVVDYVRAFSYQPAAAAAPHADVSTSTVKGTVSGQVINQTTGQPVGQGHVVLLHGLVLEQNQIEEVVSLQTTTDPDGRYVFDDVPFDLDHLVYVADLAYEGIEFNNVGFVEPDQTAPLDLPIQVYDTTQDPSVVKLETLHVVVSPQNVDTLLIAQIYVFGNSSNQVYVSDQSISETRRATVTLPVPPDAIGLAFEDGELGGRFVQTEGGVLDSAAVLPGAQSHNVVMTYLLPYDGDYTLTIPLLYETEQVGVLFEDTGLRVRSENLTPNQTDDPNLGQYQILAGQGFGPGDEIVVTIKGSPGGVGAFDNLGLMVAGGVVALALVGGGLWWWRRSASKTRAVTRATRQVAANQGRQHELMKAIADLDSAYEAGRVNKADYEARRARLKAELAALVEDEGRA